MGQKRRRRFRPGPLIVLAVIGLLAVAGFRFVGAFNKGQSIPAPPPLPPGDNMTAPVRPSGSATGGTQAGNPSGGSTSGSPASQLPASAMIRVPGQNQNPQLPNGCEVTTLSMLLGAVGHPVSKMTLAAMVPLDPTPRKLGPNGQVVSWGDPNVGFVGSMTVWKDGFGVYHGPIAQVLGKVLPGRVLDLTGQPITRILRQIADGVPVEMWVTTTLKPTTLWVTWQSPEGPVHTTLDEHVVLLVGYNQKDFFVNNPENGGVAQPVPRQDLLGAWKQLGEQAVSVTPAASTTGASGSGSA